MGTEQVSAGAITGHITDGTSSDGQLVALNATSSSSSSSSTSI